MPLEDNQLTALHARYPLKRAAITGAASGLGQALALELSRHGWGLFLNDVDETGLIKITKKCQENGSTVYSYPFNVSHYSDFSKAVDDFLKQTGGIDLVFTCAGIGVGGPFLDTKPEHLAEVIDVNLMGTIWAGKLFLPAMTQVKRGHFITIASAAAYHAMPSLSGYSASKSAVVQLSETLRSEMKSSGVDITVKMTTFYTSSIAEHTRGTEEDREKARSLVQMAPWSSEEVAEALLLHIQKRKFYMVAPLQARILWRFKRLFPELYLRLMPNLFAKLENKLLATAKERNQRT
ncbi:SDR family NAD(P)-dependent oxidoreductase [Paremcibacter congregatus]|nr:SDR family NAD(P)-dependent oxidoreductase [Paremcibacter congregatus]